LICHKLLAIYFVSAAISARGTSIAANAPAAAAAALSLRRRHVAFAPQFRLRRGSRRELDLRDCTQNTHARNKKTQRCAHWLQRLKTARCVQYVVPRRQVICMLHQQQRSFVSCSSPPSTTTAVASATRTSKQRIASMRNKLQVM
jgi:hypothetical protein